MNLHHKYLLHARYAEYIASYTELKMRMSLLTLTAPWCFDFWRLNRCGSAQALRIVKAPAERKHQEQCFTLWPEALELSLCIKTSQLIGPISQAVIILHQWLANHFNTFLMAYFAYKLDSTVRLVLVRKSCTAINTAIHKMIPLSVTVIATEMKDCISLHSCTDEI